MLVTGISGLTATNSAYSAMSSANSLMSLTRNAGNMNSRSLLNAEKKLNADMQTNSLLYKISTLMEDREKQYQKEDIKRSFSVFA